MGSIVSIERIKEEAEAAARSGQSKDEACRFPFGSPEGRKWVEIYDATPKNFEHEVARYGAAIGQIEG